MSTQVNSDGLLIRFGRDQGVRGNKAAVTTSTTKLNELILDVDLEGAARTLYTTDRNNDGTVDGFSGMDAYLPAGAFIKSQQVIVTEALAGGTNYAVGTYVEAGTADDADGIRKTDGTDGDQIGTVLTAKKFVGVVTTGTYTAGKVKIIIQYMIA